MTDFIQVPRELLQELVSNCFASIVEEGISDQRKKYRIALHQQARDVLLDVPKPEPEPEPEETHCPHGADLYDYCKLCDMEVSAQLSEQCKLFQADAYKAKVEAQTLAEAAQAENERLKEQRDLQIKLRKDSDELAANFEQQLRALLDKPDAPRVEPRNSFEEEAALVAQSKAFMGSR